LDDDSFHSRPVL